MISLKPLSIDRLRAVSVLIQSQIVVNQNNLLVPRIYAKPRAKHFQFFITKKDGAEKN